MGSNTLELKRINHHHGMLKPKPAKILTPSGGGMRQVTMVALLVGVLVLMMQCSENGSPTSVMVSTNIPAVPDTFSYVFEPVLPDSVPVTLEVFIDSIKWLYDFPSSGSSSLSIMISGESQLDLAVETYIDGVTGTAPLVRDSVGVFIDTVRIAASYQSGLILMQSSRLFVKSGALVLDSIPIVNPHAIK
jgi:hypothetical protein